MKNCDSFLILFHVYKILCIYRSIKRIKNSIDTSSEISMNSKELTIKRKIDLIKYHEETKSSQRNIALKYNVSKSQVQRILSNKTNLLNFEKNNGNKKRQRLYRMYCLF